MANAKSYSKDFLVLTKQIKSLSEKKQVFILDSIAQTFPNNEIDKSLYFQEKAVQYILQHNFNKDKCADFFMRKGQLYSRKHKPGLALGEFLKAQEIYLRTNSKTGLQAISTSLANFYFGLNENFKAIKYAQKSVKLAEELGNKQSFAFALNTLANIYHAVNNLDSAMFYFRKSASILVSIKNTYEAALTIDNIAFAFLSRNMVDSARKYNARALLMAYASKNPMLEMQLIPTACEISEKKKDFVSQLSYASRGKHLADSLKVDVYMIYSDLNLGAAYINNGEPRKGLTFLLKNVPTLAEYNDLAAINTNYFELSEAYNKLNMPDSSLYYFKLSVQYQDSLDKAKSNDKINELLSKQQLEKSEERINFLDKLNKSISEKDKLKSTIIWGSVVMLAIILVLLIITFKRFTDNKKLSKEISIKNVVLETKNNEITDSINYAKRIQEALLPSQQELTKHFPESYILFKPKDIVSGDFYWIHSTEDYVFVAVGDCTGHGVPGGFMSMLGHSFLNQIVNEKKIYEPAVILDQLRDKVITSLRQTGASGENKDGMDITFVRIDKRARKLVYAAANNEFYHISHGNLNERKADKQPIGYYSNVLRAFTNHEIDLLPNDHIYMFTDGYPDQFGGAKGKKFKHIHLQKLLLSCQEKSMETQGKIVHETFNTWKGGFEQTDDVCLVGIKIV